MTQNTQVTYFPTFLLHQILQNFGRYSNPSYPYLYPNINAKGSDMPAQEWTSPSWTFLSNGRSSQFRQLLDPLSFVTFAYAIRNAAYCPAIE